MDNVVFILSDDQGPWAVGCCGNREIRTPNLDRLAAEGTRFANFFVATPVCSPSRATLLTGRIPSQHGVYDWIRGESNAGPQGIRYLEGELAYTDVLARHGWTCGISGKWHLGDSQIPQHGFSDWFVHQSGGGPYNNAPMVRNGQLVQEPGYITDRITDEALRLLEKYHEGDYPFYLSVHYTAPHGPWTGHPQEIVDSYDRCPFASCPQEPRHPWGAGYTAKHLGNRESLKGYFAAVTAMDQNIGRILERLDSLGIRDRTLVVFLSDNGFSCGHHGFWGKGNGTQPCNMYENSIKVPAIFRHPGRIPAGRVEEAPVSAYDFMPTLLEHLALPVPTDRNLPGSSFLSLLHGEGGGDRGPVLIYDEYGPVRMIRTREWKYVHRHAGGPHELYDMLNDPDERENLASDPAHRDRIGELKARMDEWFARYVIPSRDGLRTDGLAQGQTGLMAEPAVPS